MAANVHPGTFGKITIPNSGDYNGEQLISPLVTGDKIEAKAVVKFIRQAGRRKGTTTTLGQVGLCKLVNNRSGTVA